MFLIDIACPAGALTSDDKTALAGSIVAGMSGDGFEAGDAAEPTLARARRMTHLAFSERTEWTTGDGPVPADAAPPILATVTVPESWRDDLVRHVMGTIRAAVRRLDNDHGRQRTGGDLWINVVGVRDGSIGLNGKSSTADDVLAYLTEEVQPTANRQGTLPDGYALDPTCGMRVRLGKGAITLEDNGEMLAFCAPGCRDLYVKRREPRGA